MSKKHFIVLADSVRQLLNTIDKRSDFIDPRNIPEGTVGYSNGRKVIDTSEVSELITRELSSFCSDQNGRFDRHRWLSYISGTCGPNGGKK